MRRLGLLLVLSACAPRPAALEIDALDHRVRQFAHQWRDAPFSRQLVTPGAPLRLRCRTGHRCAADSPRLHWTIDAEGVHLDLRAPGHLLAARQTSLPIEGADLALPLRLDTPGWTLAASGQNLAAQVRALDADLVRVEVRGRLDRVVATRTTPACQEVNAPSAACERRYTTRVQVRFGWSGQLDRAAVDCREWPAPAACE